jgi:hypothetical protein
MIRSPRRDHHESEEEPTTYLRVYCIGPVATNPDGADALLAVL